MCGEGGILSNVLSQQTMCAYEMPYRAKKLFIAVFKDMVLQLYSQQAYPPNLDSGLPPLTLSFWHSYIEVNTQQLCLLPTPNRPPCAHWGLNYPSLIWSVVATLCLLRSKVQSTVLIVEDCTLHKWLSIFGNALNAWNLLHYNMACEILLIRVAPHLRIISSRGGSKVQS